MRPDLLLASLAAAAPRALAQGACFEGQPAIPIPNSIRIAVGDLDGDGDLDIVTANESAGGTCTLGVIKNNGNGTFAAPAGYGVSIASWLSAAIGDVDGDGDLDAVAANGPAGNIEVLVNDGAGSFSVASVPAAGGTTVGVVLADLDDDGRLDIATVAGSSLVVLPGLGNGNFAAAVSYSVGAGGVSSIAAGDLDFDGDLDFAAASYGSSTASTLLNCSTPGHAFCAGDGSAAACPCGNASPAGSGDGCLNSLGLAGRLRASGGASVAHDSLVLLGTQMPNAAALYFQGTTKVNGGAGAVFGDGLRCVGGAVARPKTVINAGNASQHPELGDPQVSVAGTVTPGMRFYQVWYRNAASFCTVSTFNLSNGLAVVWHP